MHTDDDDFDFSPFRGEIYRNTAAIEVSFDAWRDGVMGRRFVIMPHVEQGSRSNVAYRSAVAGETDVVCLSSYALQVEDGTARLLEALRAHWEPGSKSSVGLGSLDLAVDVVRAAQTALGVAAEELWKERREAIDASRQLVGAHRERLTLAAGKTAETPLLVAGKDGGS